MNPDGYETENEALLAAKKWADDEGFVDFSGMNCNDYLSEGDDECLGWDGYDRRCQCGNRRVYWNIQQNEDGRWSAYAEAY